MVRYLSRLQTLYQTLKTTRGLEKNSYFRSRFREALLGHARQVNYDRSSSCLISTQRPPGTQPNRSSSDLTQAGPVWVLMHVLQMGSKYVTNEAVFQQVGQEASNIGITKNLDSHFLPKKDRFCASQPGTEEKATNITSGTTQSLPLQARLGSNNSLSSVGLGPSFQDRFS